MAGPKAVSTGIASYGHSVAPSDSQQPDLYSHINQGDGRIVARHWSALPWKDTTTMHRRQVLQELGHAP